MMTSKAERDRAIGQTLTYADEYDLVWLAIIDTPRRCIDELWRILETHDIEDVAVWTIESELPDDD